jgi:hypothetical protein
MRLFIVLQIAFAFTRYEAFVTATVLGGALVFGELLLQALARTIARQTADDLARNRIDIAPGMAGAKWYGATDSNRGTTVATAFWAWCNLSARARV